MSTKRSTARDEPRPATWSSLEYLAECEARSRKIRISYVDHEHWVTARLNATWKRDDPEIARGPRMSASSGPKDYLINDVIALFGANEMIEQVALLILNRVMFLIVRVGPHWYDRSTPEPRLVMVKMEG